ncbi:MAG: SBBP repeat-containing protein [Bacteroidales bacterium]|nr:SBBP repeat-containing protein [Bacteroidales bacterium]
MKKIVSLFAIVAILLINFSSCKEKDTDDTDITLPDGFSSSSITTGFSLTYGGSGNNDDELVSGMVADNSGNMYITMNITDAAANKDIIVVKVNADGTLGWAQRYNNNGNNDWSPDSGENSETGGTANSISIDTEGNVYVIGTTTEDNASESTIVLKISHIDGSIIWQKMWKEQWPTGTPTASQSNQGYGLDAESDYVYVTGATGTNKVIVVALNKADGTIFYQYTLDIVNGTKDRGYVVKQSPTGDLFIGGVTGSYAYIAKINGGNTSSPTLAWVKNAGLSYAARINGIDIDASGVYLSCDIRGVQTYFEAMKLDFDGNFQWAKTFQGADADRNNTHVVKIDGNFLYVGGRIGESGLDTYYGDGLLLKMDKANGDLNWAKIYYTGNSSEEAAEHRIKGIAINGANILVAGQVYGSNDNVDHFLGEWIENSALTLQNVTNSLTNVSSATFEQVNNGEVRDGVGEMSADTGILQNAKDKTTLSPPDGDAFMMKFNL